MKTFKKSMAIILSILMLFSVMTVAGISASAADGETATIYFVNSGKWDTVSSYVWVSGGASLKAWPGTAMTATGEKAANGADVYALEYADAGYDRVIFNDGKATDTIQTETIVLKHGLYYDYLTQSWYTDATLEEEVTDPTVDPSQIKYYVAGQAGLCGEEWKAASEAGLMTANGDGTYTKVFTGIAKGKYGFKITDGSWDHSWGADGPNTMTNYSVTVDADNSDVTITFDLNAGVATAVVTAGATPSESSEDTTPSETESQETTASETESQETTPSETESQETTPSETESQETTPSETESQETTPSETTEPTEAPTLPAKGRFHVVAGAPELCNGVNWDPASPLNLMTLGDDGVYSITYTNVPAGTHGFKVTTKGAWDVADFNLVGDAKFGGPDAKITVTEDNSTVMVTFKESDMHANAYINGVKVDMGATEPTLPTEGTFHVVAGVPELCNGVNWDPASTLNLMTLGADGVYSITYTYVPAGTYKFKVTTNGAWDNGEFNLVGDATFGGADAEITVTEDDSTVIISLKESDMHANAFINGVKVDMGATEPTQPTETEPKPTETVCEHSVTTTSGKKAATYFEKGYTGDTVCADCGEVVAKGSAIAKKVLKTPKVTVKAAKKAIKVTYKKVKDAKGFVVTYKLGKKTYNEKVTLSKKELKKAKVTKTIKVKKTGKYKVTVKAFVKSGKKVAYSDPTKAATAKVK